jgi:ATP-dependent DNA helicase RecG
MLTRSIVARVEHAQSDSMVKAPRDENATPAKRQAPASGPQRAMERLGLKRDIDLVLHLPLRYEDETTVSPIAALREGDTGLVEGVVTDSRIDSRGRRQLLAWMKDNSGELVLRFLNFYPAQQKSLAPGQRLRARGELRVGYHGREMVHPTVKAVVEGSALPQSLTPVYPSSAALPQGYLRKAVTSALQRTPLEEVLPPGCVPAGLPTLKDAVRLLHQPPPQLPLASLEDRSHPAWQRLKFDELLAQQLAQADAQRKRALLRAPMLRWLGDTQLDVPTTYGNLNAEPAGTGEPSAIASGLRTNELVGDRASLHSRLLAVLPFGLTGAQQRVCREIDSDIAKPVPMHRLLQGDVGSGKTVVAALAAARAMDAGWQCALMAPTEILAEQHFRKLVQWLEPLGITVAWLTGSRKGRARNAMLERVASGEAALVVGTHAVIQSDVHFAKLGLAIVDEQHRFGVAQRLALREKLQVQALEPHLLMMSATPIPRTLAMTYFADLDVSTIDELPPGRTPVVTKVFADNRRGDVIQRIHDEVAKGRQVYWVCPLIEESETLDLQNATETHQQLSAALPRQRVGLLHGRMPPAEKAAVMAQFASSAPVVVNSSTLAVTPEAASPTHREGATGSTKDGGIGDIGDIGDNAKPARLDVLVATTVIEVGVDVPNASLMVIEHAERFGLSQLHQLRGRVGRGAVASVCVLLYTPPLSDTGKARLRAMAETTDGFEIARRDLDIRGPGEFMGARQSGDALLRFADLNADSGLLHVARQWAQRLWAEHPQAAQAHVARWLGSKQEFLKA